MAELDAFADACTQATRQLRRMPADLRRALGRHVKTQVTDPLARKVAAAASSSPPYGALLAGSVRTRAGAEPTIVVGGARRVASQGATARDLVYGQNFGGKGRRRSTVNRTGARTFKRRSTVQFLAYRPFIFPTFAREAEETFEAWLEVLEPYLREWEDRT